MAQEAAEKEKALTRKVKKKSKGFSARWTTCAMHCGFAPAADVMLAAWSSRFCWKSTSLVS